MWKAIWIRTEMSLCSSYREDSSSCCEHCFVVLWRKETVFWIRIRSPRVYDPQEYTIPLIQKSLRVLQRTNSEAIYHDNTIKYSPQLWDFGPTLREGLEWKVKLSNKSSSNPIGRIFYWKFDLRDRIVVSVRLTTALFGERLVSGIRILWRYQSVSLSIYVNNFEKNW